MAIFGEMGMKSYIPNVNAPRYTQEFCEIDRIDKGMIVTKDKRYVKILEVMPINFYSNTLQDQEFIINDFAAWLRVAPISFQIKIITKRSDPTKVIDRVIAAYEHNDDSAVEIAVGHYVDLLQRLGKNGAVTKKFYLVIQFEPQTQIQKKFNEDQIADTMDRSAREIRSYFRDMGNIVLFIDEKEREHSRDSEDWSLGELFYSLYNPRTSSNEQGRPAVELQDRVDRVIQDAEKAGQKDIDMASFFTSKGIDFEQKGCVVMDGLYYTSFAIASDGYPMITYGGWMGHLLELMIPGDSIDIFFKREDPEKMLTKASQKLRFTVEKLSSRTIASKDSERVLSAKESVEYIKAGINTGAEVPYYFSVIFTLSGLRYNDLMERKTGMMKYLTSLGYKTDAFPRTQEDVIRSTFPLLSLDPKVYERTRRNALSSDLASIYPFTSFEIQNTDGFLLGLNEQNGTIMLLNPWDTTMYTNGNMTILGTSGAGKTFTECIISLRLRELGTQCFFIAPLKGHEFQRGCKQLGGEFVTIASSSKDHINIMEVRPRVSASAEFIEAEEMNATSIVADKVRAVSAFLELTCPSIRQKHVQKIDSCIMKTYRKFGFDLDNDSIYVDNDPEKGLKKMPIIGDLFNVMEEENENGIFDDVLEDMDQFIHGRCTSFNAQTNVDLKNKYIVFDVSKLDDSIRTGGMFLVLDFIMGRVKEDILENKIVFIDEGWRLIGTGSNTVAAGYVIDLFKEIRGYNGAACIATQDINDFFALEDGKYGRSILGNSGIKFILRLDKEESKYVADKVGLSPEEARKVVMFERGQCILIAGNNHIPVKVTASDYAVKLFTTDARLVAKTIEEMKENGGMIV